MLIQKLKKILSGILSSIVIVLACFGGYKVYKEFKPIIINRAEQQTQTIRIKLESIGKIKVAESVQKIKKTHTEGKNKFFRNVYVLINQYKTNYEYDLSDIEIISDIDNKNVTMQIDTNKLMLGDIYLIKDDSYSASTLLSPIITEQKKQNLRNAGRLEVTKLFKNDEEFKETALDTLKNKLATLVSELGFKNIEIEII